MGPDARRANIRSVLITDVHISGANCTSRLSRAYDGSTYLPGTLCHSHSHTTAGP